MNTIFLLWTIFWLLRITIEDIRSFTIPNRFTLAILLAAPFLSAAPVSMRLLAAALPFCLLNSAIKSFCLAVNL
jgi:Flp pilus assembly protein protease CpaA